MGEAVMGIIEPQNGQTLDEAAIRAFLREHLAHYKIPKFIEFRTGLPREDSGKLFKRKLREPYWKEAGRAI